MANKIIHKHSSSLVNGKAKLPDESKIEYGELAINYANGHETISLKNNSDNIVEFVSKKYIDSQDTTLSAQINAVSLKADSSDKYNTSLDDEFTVPNTVGGITGGTTVEQLKGKTITSIIDDLLFPTINPTKTSNPSVSIKLNKTTTPVEIGTNSYTITGYTFDKGKWSDNTEYAGSVSSVTYTAIICGTTYSSIGSVPDLSNKSYGKVGDQTYQISLTYNPGPKPLNNKGHEVSGAPSGVVTGQTVIKVTRPYFVRLTSDTEMTKKLTACTVSGNNATISIGKIGTIPDTSTLTGDYIFKVWGSLTKLEVDDAFSPTKVSSLLDSLVSETKSDGYTYYRYKDGLNVGELTINNGTIKFTA